MDNSTQYELMRYIDGEMSDGEKVEFEKRMGSDEVLKQEVSNMQLARQTVRQYGVKEKVAGIHTQMMEELKNEAPVKAISRVRRIIRFTVAVAASVLLIFVLIEGYKFYTLTPGKLYAENYTAYELTTTRDGNNSSTAIENAYREKKFAEVINLNRNSVLSIKDVFLTGLSYLETKDYAKAISSFQIVIADVKDDKTTLKDAAEYYLALAFLQNRDYDLAIEQMNAINSNPSHLYRAKFSRSYINQVKRLKWR